MEKDEILIHELARETGVSTRTIRYYAQEGLLPEPVIQGKYAYYTERHIQRLKLILLLKDSYLPLKEIRQFMNSLTDQEVQEMLEKKQLESMGKATQYKVQQNTSESALEYITNLLQTQSHARSVEPPPPKATLPASPRMQAAFASLPTEHWKVLSLAPGIELKIKEPLSATDQQRLEELIYYAKKIFKT